MPINNSYDEAAIVEAIATALDNFYTNLIKKVDSLNVKTVMKRKNPYLFRAKGQPYVDCQAPELPEHKR